MVMTARVRGQMMGAPQARHSLIGQTPSFAVAISHYPPYLIQPSHQHRNSRLSFLLAGSLVEVADGRSLQIQSPHLCRKPKGTVHSDRYGDHGALILSVHFKCEQTAALALDGTRWRWSVLSEAQRSALIACVAEAKDAESDTELWDILAGGEEAEACASPPSWLGWAKACIETEPGQNPIAKIAALPGVHRVHLSREFSRYYGVSPSVFRKRQMSARALSLIVQQGVPAAVAAQESGFADQAHMTRTIKRVVGLTPGRISGLLG